MPAMRSDKFALRLLIASTAVLVALLGLRIPGVAQTPPNKIVISGSGGSYDECQKKTFVADWEQRTKVHVTFGSPYWDMGSWKAQQETGKVEWDVTPIDAAQASELIGNGWLTPINKSIIAKNGGLLNVPDVTITRNGNLYTLPTEIFAMVITYNTDKFGASPPKTWADVFNVSKYPGKRVFSKDVSDFGTLEVALLADGVPRDKLYPLDVERALRKLDTIKNEIVWYQSGAQQVTLLQQNEAVIGLGWDGRIKFLKRQGGHVEFTTQDAILRPDYVAIPRGAHVKAANDFLAFMTQPQELAKFYSCIGYSPAWKAAYKYLPTDQQFTISNAQDLSRYVMWSLNYWEQNRRAVTDRFNKWLSQ